MIKVAKFGGTSVRNLFDKLPSIIADDKERRIIVASAPGTRKGEPKKHRITPRLARLAVTYDGENHDAILSTYYQLGHKHMDVLDIELSRRLKENYFSLAARLDSIKAWGEWASGQLLTERLQESGMPAIFVPARDVFVASENYGAAQILSSSDVLIKSRFSNNDQIFVLEGFSGITETGNIVTFPSGGSDLSGSYVAAILKANTYENFTDELGIRKADPAIVPDAQVISKMTYDELSELLVWGFKVFQEEALWPVADHHVKTHIRSSFHYPHEGTYVVPSLVHISERPTGIVYNGEYCSFRVRKRGMFSMVGSLSLQTKIFSDEDLSIDFDTTGSNEKTWYVRSDRIDDERMHRLIDRFQNELGAHVEFNRNIGCIVVAGEVLQHKRYTIDRNITALLEKHHMRIHGSASAPLSLFYAIDTVNGPDIVKLLYADIINS
jgi:aspartate kinase